MVLSGIVRGVIGFITTAILGGICLGLGFAPDAWIASLWFEPSGWLSHPLLKLAFVLGGGFFAILTWRFFGRLRVAFDGPVTATPASVIRASENSSNLRTGFRVKDGYAQVFVRNLSSEASLDSVEALFANYSIDADAYQAIDLHYSLKPFGLSHVPITINPGDQKYFPFAQVRSTEGKSRVFLFDGKEPPQCDIGHGCVAKIRVSAKNTKAQTRYIQLVLHGNGNLILKEYKGHKGKD